MKPKHLIPLIVIVAVLVALVVVKKTAKPTPSIVEQTGLVALLPEGLSKGDVAKLEIYAGAAPDESLALAYDADADTWRVTTHFDAPVQQDKIDQYLEAIVGLKGEPRAMGVSDEDLASYELADDAAFHVKGYKKDAEEPLFHLLIGKSPGYQTVFLREADGNDVFVEDTNLRQKAGIYGDDMTKGPEPGTWLNKEVLKIEKDEIMKVALTLPDKAIVFENREKPKKEEKAEETDEAEESAPDQSDQPEAEAEEEAPPEYEWVLASGGPCKEHKESGLTSLLGKLSSLTASDIVDPDKKADWGLEEPSYVCVVSLKDQDDVRIEGGRPDPSSDGYVQVVGAKEELVYKLSKYTFEQVFPKGTSLFDLPTPSADKDKMTSVSITQPDGAVRLAKSDGDWAIEEPAADLEARSSTLDTIASTLPSWKPGDYADAGAVDLGAPTRTVSFVADDKTHSVKLYGDSKSSDGVYAQIDDRPDVLVMARTDFDKIFKERKELYDRSLLDVDEDDIREIHVSGLEGMFSLARPGEDQDWKLTVGGDTVDTDDGACDDLAQEVADLEANDVLFGQAEMSDPVESTVRIKMDDGAEHSFSFGADKDGAHQLAVAGRAQAFVVDHTDWENLFPAADDLKKPEPPPEENKEETAPAEGAEAASVEKSEAVLIETEATTPAEGSEATP